jgi:Na+-driven multidrug efflux pump
MIAWNSQAAFFLYALAPLVLLGYIWNVRNVRRGGGAKGLAIAAMIVRTLGPVAFLALLLPYRNSLELFGAWVAFVRAAFFMIAFLFAAFVLDVILVRHARSGNQPSPNAGE